MNNIRSTLPSLDFQSVVEAAKIDLCVRKMAHRRREPLKLVREWVEGDVLELLAIRQRVRSNNAGELREPQEIPKDGLVAATQYIRPVDALPIEQMGEYVTTTEIRHPFTAHKNKEHVEETK